MNYYGLNTPAAPVPGYYPGAYTAGPLTQQPQNFQQQENLQSGSRKWVQGEAGAKSYLVAPNRTVDLWDSERNTIYLKSADASGMPSMKILDYTVRDSSQQVETPAQNIQGAQFVTLEDFNALRGEFEALRNSIENHKCRCHDEKRQSKNNLVANNDKGGR